MALSPSSLKEERKPQSQYRRLRRSRTARRKRNNAARIRSDPRFTGGARGKLRHGAEYRGRQVQQAPPWAPDARAFGSPQAPQAQNNAENLKLRSKEIGGIYGSRTQRI